MVSPQLGDKLCPRCSCQYQTRNTGVIRAVVSLVLFVLALLCLYMAFLLCLNRGMAFAAAKAAYGHVAYHQQTNEDVSLALT